MTPKDLFNKLRLQWLDTYSFEDPALQFQIQKEFKSALDSKERALALKWNGAYYRRSILNNESPQLFAKWLGDRIGFGLFTEHALKSGSFIGTYLGKVRRKSPLKTDHINAYSFAFPLQPSGWLGGWGWGWTIDALQQGNHTRFLNHSEDANCEAVGAICHNQIYIIIRAKRAIEPGEQILYNYGNAYWSKRSSGPQKLD